MTWPQRSAAARWGGGLLRLVIYLAVGAFSLWLLITLYVVYLFH